jgi:tetratricopeptide (TPR) repeat protein
MAAKCVRTLWGFGQPTTKSARTHCLSTGNGLRAALAAAADIEARGELPQNTGDQLQAVLREVARLNSLGEREAAADTLDEAMQQIEAQREAIFNLQLSQDRVLNTPQAAASRLIQNLHHNAPPGGVWKATLDLSNEWREKGETQGSPFDLQVALHLAKQNLGRAKRPQKGPALISLGICYLRLGERSGADSHLKQAVKIFRELLKLVSRRTDPTNWAATQNNLGGALQTLGERQQDPAHLNAAIAAYTAALTVRTRAAVPMGWAMTQNNLAICYRSLAVLTTDNTFLDKAETAYINALKEWTREAAPHDWANTTGGLGELALDRYDFNKDPSHLPKARNYILEAREVMAEGDEYLTIRCDALLARIEAAEQSAAKT